MVIQTESWVWCIVTSLIEGHPMSLRSHGQDFKVQSRCGGVTGRWPEDRITAFADDAHWISSKSEAMVLQRNTINRKQNLAILNLIKVRLWTKPEVMDRTINQATGIYWLDLLPQSPCTWGESVYWQIYVCHSRWPYAPFQLDATGPAVDLLHHIPNK